MLAAWVRADPCCAAVVCLALALVLVLGLLRDAERRNDQLRGEKERLDYELLLHGACGVPTNAYGTLGAMQDPRETRRQQDAAGALNGSIKDARPLFMRGPIATGLPVVVVTPPPPTSLRVCGGTGPIVITAPSLVASSDLLSPADAAARGPPTFAPPPPPGALDGRRPRRRARAPPSAASV